MANNINRELLYLILEVEIRRGVFKDTDGFIELLGDVLKYVPDNKINALADEFSYDLGHYY